ncbi:MAG: N-6 DNA methylase [Nitrosomonadales bacterium]
MPDQLFYNTGIGTYIWIVTNRKEVRRKGKVQLIDARNFFVKMKKSLGNKRNKSATATKANQIRSAKSCVSTVTFRMAKPASSAQTVKRKRWWSAAFSTTPISATTRSPSNVRYATNKATSSSPAKARTKASPSRTRNCATPRTCR